jgi:cell division protease FtsH
VEVDGVNVMFKLKGGVENVGDGEVHESDSLVKGVAPTKRIVYATTKPSYIRTPYEKMLESEVEFGSPDKCSGGFFNFALVC